MKRTLAGLIALLLLAGGVRADITSNLVAHWKLDETSGTSAADSSGNGHTGTYVNTPTLGVTGAFGNSKAVTYDSATGECTTVGTNTLLKNTGAGTLSCWAKWTTAATNTYLVSLRSGSGSTNRLALVANRTAAGRWGAYAVAGDAEATQIKEHAGTLNDGNWHHLVAAVDYANDVITMYVDGAAVTASGTISFTATATSNTDSTGCGLSALATGANGTSGTLDDVRIYSRALSAADVAELYAYTGARFPYWYFNSSGCDPFKVFRTRQPLAILTTR